MRNRTTTATSRARELRRTMSDSERILWGAVRNRIQQFKFRRQYAVGPYVLDFYCAESRLCIEVDGEHHAYRQNRDANRDSFLAEMHIHTIRFPSMDMYEALDSVIDEIVRVCQERSTKG